MNDLAAWLRKRLDEDEEDIRDSRSLSPGELDWSMPQWMDRDRMLAEVEAKRRILELHEPTITTVEWWDAPEVGSAPTCPACVVAEPNEWPLPIGAAGLKPEGWVSAYILAPCPTIRLLALPHADQAGYKEEWRP